MLVFWFVLTGKAGSGSETRRTRGKKDSAQRYLSRDVERRGGKKIGVPQDFHGAGHRAGRRGEKDAKLKGCRWERNLFKSPHVGFLCTQPTSPPVPRES